MASQSESGEKKVRTRRPPATTPEGRENQLIGLAVDLAEKQLIEGTASAQVITQFLKLGSTREQLEQARLREEVEYMKTKREAIASHARTEEMYKNALNAMREYNGQDPLPPPEFEDD